MLLLCKIKMTPVVLSSLKTLGLITFYYFFSAGLTFYNKWTLSEFPFPLSMTMIHILSNFIIVWLSRKVLVYWSRELRPSLPWKQFVKHVVPVAVFSVIDIGLSNWSLIFISVSLYTMSKSSALIFIFLFAVVLKLEKPVSSSFIAVFGMKFALKDTAESYVGDVLVGDKRLLMVIVVLFIVIGLFLFTYHSTKFVLNGFLLVMTASVVSGLRWTTAQLTLQKEELRLSNPIDLLYHLLPVMALTLLPLALTIDGVRVGTSAWVFRASSFNTFSVTAAVVLGSTLLALFLNLSEFLLVYHTSGLTLSIAGILKEIIILTVSTMWWEDESLSTLNVTGMIVCVAGITTHTVVKAYDTHVDKKVVFREDHVELLAGHSQHNCSDSDIDDVDVAYRTTST